MTKMYFIGPDNAKGTYYWYSEQLRAWIVADLDTEKANYYDKLATIELVDKTGMAEIKLTGKIGLGQHDNKWLVSGESLLYLLREYPDEVKSLMVYYENGSQLPYGKVEKEIAKVTRKLKKKGKKLFGEE